MNRHKQISRNKEFISKKHFILVALIFGLVAASCGVFLIVRKNNVANSTKQTSPYKTATKEEKQDAENIKDKIVESQQKQNSTLVKDNTSLQKISVKPIITNANGSINAYVQSIFEDGGTCTAIIAKGTTILTKTSVGFQNVSYTQCAPMNLEPGLLTSGTWSVYVKYSSDKSEGTSDSQKIEVK